MTPAPANASWPEPGTSSGPQDLLVLSPEQAQAIVRLVEAAPGVRRRYQFFVWTQSQMQALLPHQLLVCGAYQRQRRAVVLDAFHSIVLAPELLASLTDPQSPLVAALVAHWLDGRGRPRALDLASRAEGAAQAAAMLRDQLGCTHLLVHGVSRPQRPAEIESLFILGGPGGGLPLAQRGDVTGRERQILRWVREGKSNQQIAEVLGISPLTVKNHIQKILRKLGAGNRAQAEAQALSRNLIDAAERPIA